MLDQKCLKPRAEGINIMSAAGVIPIAHDHHVFFFSPRSIMSRFNLNKKKISTAVPPGGTGTSLSSGSSSVGGPGAGHGDGTAGSSGPSSLNPSEKLCSNIYVLCLRSHPFSFFDVEKSAYTITP